MTRAADMTAGGCSTQPVGLLDWGHESVTFVVAYHGRPEFVRSFRSCGSGRVLTTLQEGLGLSEEDARHVLAASVLPGKSRSSIAPTALNRTVEQLVTPEIQRVAAKVKKTLLNFT